MIHDISPPISPRLPVWPGDAPFRREVMLDMERGDRLTLSALSGTAHLGAHVDAPSHYGRGAPAIDQRSLEYFIGPCQVIRIPALPRSAIPPDLLPAPIRAPRVLLATDSYPRDDRFHEDFAGLSPESVEWLSGQGVILVGIDTPSVDPFDAVDIPAHQMFLKLDMAILEGLVLDDIPEGIYELIALPLRLEGFDASPVRAILRDL